VSADLAVHYVRAGWLRRLARGVYARPETPLELYPSLRLLERRVKGLHVGGKSALDWHGVRHNVAQQAKLQLYGWASGSLATWFTKHFPSNYHRLRLFDEQPSSLLRVSRFAHKVEGPLASEPERAVLELLSEVVGRREVLGNLSRCVVGQYESIVALSLEYNSFEDMFS
jgi:hypothetical protein